jgi:quinoprotein dehydrogenase-associated probable ABC transporter substrate-binding protein
MKSVKLAIILYVLSAQVAWSGDGERTVLKVCADPYNLPYSNKDSEGFENKIAELFAKELGLPLKYEWFPQRMGFIRNTLKSEGTDGEFKCDLVIGVPDRFELAATTKPYFASTYAFVYAKGRGIKEMRTGDDIDSIPEEIKRNIRVGAFDRGPGQLWLFKHGLFSRMKPYMSQSGDVRVNPIIVLDDIVDNVVDATVIWGPIAGYYARNNKKVELVVIPLQSSRENAEMKFDYNISMAVRYGENSWKARVDSFIENNQRAINQILEDYGIPVVNITPTLSDDDD